MTHDFFYHTEFFLFLDIFAPWFSLVCLSIAPGVSTRSSKVSVWVCVSRWKSLWQRPAAAAAAVRKLNRLTFVIETLKLISLYGGTLTYSGNQNRFSFSLPLQILCVHFKATEIWWYFYIGLDSGVNSLAPLFGREWNFLVFYLVESKMNDRKIISRFPINTCWSMMNDRSGYFYWPLNKLSVKMKYYLKFTR